MQAHETLSVDQSINVWGIYLIPDGFPELVSLVLEDWDDLKTEDSGIWDAFLYPVFLGATIRSAQAYYMREVLHDFLEFKVVQKMKNDPIWSKKILKALNTRLSSIKGTPGEGFKKAILKAAIQQVESLDLSRTIGDALSFFGKYKINAAKITNLQNNYRGTLNLVDLAAREIFNFRYVKSVLWLYGCGIAEDIVPPNAHVTRFLDECGYPGFGWSRDLPSDWQVFAPACKYMREVANQVSLDLGVSVTPKQAQAAVWYLQACRGLFPTGYKSKLTPVKLVDFLRVQKWNIHNLSIRLDDVEQLEDLALALKTLL